MASPTSIPLLRPDPAHQRVELIRDALAFIREGLMIAVVMAIGDSGEGKSTLLSVLVDLLTGFEANLQWDAVVAKVDNRFGANTFRSGRNQEGVTANIDVANHVFPFRCFEQAAAAANSWRDPVSNVALPVLCATAELENPVIAQPVDGVVFMDSPGSGQRPAHEMHNVLLPAMLQANILLLKINGRFLPQDLTQKLSETIVAACETLSPQEPAAVPQPQFLFKHLAIIVGDDGLGFQNQEAAAKELLRRIREGELNDGREALRAALTRIASISVHALPFPALNFPALDQERYEKTPQFHAAVARLLGDLAPYLTRGAPISGVAATRESMLVSLKHVSDSRNNNQRVHGAGLLELQVRHSCSHAATQVERDLQEAAHFSRVKLEGALEVFQARAIAAAQAKFDLLVPAHYVQLMSAIVQEYRTLEAPVASFSIQVSRRNEELKIKLRDDENHLALAALALVDKERTVAEITAAHDTTAQALTANESTQADLTNSRDTQLMHFYERNVVATGLEEEYAALRGPIQSARQETSALQQTLSHLRAEGTNNSHAIQALDTQRRSLCATAAHHQEAAAVAQQNGVAAAGTAHALQHQLQQAEAQCAHVAQLVIVKRNEKAHIQNHPPTLKQTVIDYHIKSGDCLINIGKKFGVNYKQIAHDNHIKNPNLIHAGKWLKIHLSHSANENASAKAHWEHALSQAKAALRAAKDRLANEQASRNTIQAQLNQAQQASNTAAIISQHQVAATAAQDQISPVDQQLQSRCAAMACVQAQIASHEPVVQAKELALQQLLTQEASLQSQIDEVKTQLSNAQAEISRLENALQRAHETHTELTQVLASQNDELQVECEIRDRQRAIVDDLEISVRNLTPERD